MTMFVSLLVSHAMVYVTRGILSDVAQSVNLNLPTITGRSVMENAFTNMFHARAFVKRNIRCNVRIYALVRIAMTGGDAMGSVSAHQYHVRAIATMSNQSFEERNVLLRRIPWNVMASARAYQSHVMVNV